MNPHDPAPTLQQRRTVGVDGRHFAIGVLTMTAVILLVGNILVSQESSRAYGSGMTSSGGDYILTTGRVQSVPAQNPEELLYVIDTSASRLVAYAFDAQSHKLKPTSHFDLKDMAKQGEKKPPDTTTNPPPRPGTRQPSQPRKP